ncbi:EAL domain-containing protein [Pseudocolwellia agarivorans]|uniref:EAL domain-containing protein n=1 Tax=Pseudocolwellia agarivorans TaxID=1911682 RepID=UPI0009852248|nr:EAL domain-containing protein [Pseudocolwellia agarivorans]
MKPRQQSIKHNIQSVVLRALMLCLLLLFIAVLTLEYLNTDRIFRQNIKNISSLVASYSIPTLLFNDEEEATNTLNILNIDKRIIKAQINKKNGQVLAERTFIKQKKLRDAYMVKIDIIEEKVTLGTLTLWVDLSDQQFNLIKIFFILLVLSVLSLFIAYLLSKRLPSPITVAISNVVHVFKEIRQTQNFNRRVESSNISEMDTIVNGLNSMLEQLENREYELQRNKEKLEIALKSSGEGIWEFDPRLSIITSDYTTQAIIQQTKDITIPFNNSLNDDQSHYITWLKRFDRKDRSKIFHNIKELLLANIKGFKIECRIKCTENSFRWVNIHGLLSYDQVGHPTSIIGTIVDIHEQRKAAQENELLSAIFQKTQDPVVVIDSSFIIQAANNAFSQHTNIKPHGKHLEQFFDKKYHDRYFFDHIKNSILKKHNWEGELRFLTANKEEPPMWLSLIPVSKGKNINYLGTFSQLSQRQSIEDELRYLAHYDSLTDLPNRRMFNDRLNQCLKASKRNKYNFAIVFIDVDDFKNINDTLGHKVGDEVLISFAKGLTLPLRNIDTVARLGGDEFIVLLEQCGTRKEVAAVTERLFEEVSKPLLIENHKLLPSSSIGIAYYPDDGLTAEELMTNADLAMYRAKKDKKTPYLFFKSEWGKIADRQSKLRYALATAIENNELYITLQPKFDIKTLHIESAEALIRWEHPQHGFISPVEFIPLAEDSGLIEEIGNWVLHQVAATLERWKDTNLAHINIAVNVSAVQFDEDKLLKELKILTNCYNFPIEKLELELTESILLKSESKATEILNQIKEMGFLMSIDDFGTGYSSLQYLSKFPVQALKIDRSFINNFESDLRNETIVKAIIAMAQGLGMKVIAEGIETHNQLELLATMGTDIGQGYWCSKPIRIPEFELFIHEWFTKTSNSNDKKETLDNE